MIPDELRECLVCGSRVIGRHDKKFCSDSCRNCFNNKRYSREQNLLRNVNNILRRNRRILQELTPKGKTRISRLKLASMGFSFEYYTSSYTTKTGNVFYFCYDYGYQPLGNEKVALVKKPDISG